MARLDFRAPGRALPLAELLARLPVAPTGGRGGGLRLADGTPLGPRDAVPPGARVLGPACEVGLPELPEADAGGDWTALAPALPWLRGSLAAEEEDGIELAFEVRERRGALAELSLRAPGLDARAVCERLAAAGAPVLGDVLHGGVLVGGGLRLCAGPPASEGWWPDEPVWLESEADGRSPVYRISQATRRALDSGHPWVRPDDESDDPGRFAPGAMVVLRANERDVGLARVDGGGAVAARLWARDCARPRDSASVEARIARALARRRALIAAADDPDGSDVFRLIHGEADALPAVAVDRLGEVLRVQWRGRSALAIRERVLDALLSQLGPRPVVEVWQLRDPPRGRLECVRVARGELGPERFVVRERGLRFAVDPGLAEPDRPRPGVGLFADQRENRERVAARAARGGRWLNLFAHTGAFSAAALAAGADEVVSVDLSSVYIDWLEENLERNGLLDSRHRPVRQDGRRFLEKLPPGERFDGIVLDPPSAAAAGRRYWSVARGLEPLVGAALSRLTDGGWLLACRNDRRGRAADLETLVRRAADAHGVALADVQAAPPASDFPSLPHFHEGDPFRGVLARCAVRDRSRANRGV